MTLPGSARLIKAADVGHTTPLRGAASRAEAKRNEAETPRSVWRKRAVHEANQEAAELIDDATQTAGALVDAARREAQNIADAAQADVEARVRAEWTSAFDALRANVLLDVEAREERVVTLAKLLAERLLHAELALRPEAIGSLAQQVLLGARGATRFVLSAHPSHIERLRALLVPTLPALTLREDGCLGTADVRLDTEVGSVDGSVKTQLDRLGSVLLGRSH